MGKTRLIEQLLRAARCSAAARVLRGYCESDLGAEPLQPFRHMLQSLAGDAPPGSPERLRRARSTALAAQQPLLLFVDDWQWADDASHQVLAALRRRAGRRA